MASQNVPCTQFSVAGLTTHLETHVDDENGAHRVHPPGLTLAETRYVVPAPTAQYVASGNNGPKTASTTMRNATNAAAIPTFKGVICNMI